VDLLRQMITVEFQEHIIVVLVHFPIPVEQGEEIVQLPRLMSVDVFVNGPVNFVIGMKKIVEIFME